MKYNRLPVCILLFISVFIILCSCGEVSNNENRTTHKPESSAASTLDSSYSPSSTPGPDMYIITYEQLVDSILREAQTVADFIRDNDFDYSEDLRINPAYNWAELDETKALDSSERLVSCDRFVGWVLHDLGFVDGQPTTSGLGLYGSKNLENFLKENGFIKITDKSQLKPADIIFVGDSAEHYPNLQGAWLDYPDHVFIYACEGDDGLFYRYDAGSTKRIKSNQPSCEPLEYSPEKLFRFAYRLPQAQ